MLAVPVNVGALELGRWLPPSPADAAQGQSDGSVEGTETCLGTGFLLAIISFRLLKPGSESGTHSCPFFRQTEAQKDELILPMVLRAGPRLYTWSVWPCLGLLLFCFVF